MSFGISMGLHAFSSRRSYNPAALSLTGWWQGSFSGSPWTGSSSAGASSGREYIEATNPPATGASLNGFTSANFDGTNDILTNATLTSDDWFTPSAGSIWILFKSNNAIADDGFNNPTLIADTGAYFSISFSDLGTTFAIYDVISFSHKILTVSTTVSSWHLAQLKWDGVNMYVRVDNTSWTSLACGDSGGAASLRMGVSCFDVAYFNGDIMDIGFTNTTLSDADFNNIVIYVNNRYGLSI